MKKLALFLSFLFVISCSKDPIIYTLTTSANPSEGGTVSPSTQQFEEGETATIIAAPSAEYVFQNWSGATGSASSTTVVMNSDKSVTANFVKKKYALNVEVEGLGTVNESVIKEGTATDYNSGSIIELSAVADDGWEFKEWTGDLKSTENPVQVNIDSNKNIKAIFTTSVQGNIQKGPFLSGTSLTIYELYDNLSQTGKSFASEIVSDNGKFSIENLNLLSNLVRINADGYYFNEVSGKNSTGQISLSLIAKVSENDINVNVLTAIERPRLEYLITNGSSFDDARSQAQSEILKIFEIEKNDTESFENLDITKAGDGNAILLAISAIIQGDRSDSEVSELISNIANDIKEDGVLTNADLGAKLLSHAIYLKPDEIRINLEDKYKKLNEDITIPAFEPILEKFTLNSSFEKNYNPKKLTIEIDGEGSVDEKVIKVGGSTDYNGDSVIELTATPSDEWLFVEWTGDLESTDNPAQITIDKAKTITAVFVKKQYPLTIEIEGEGTVAEKVIKAGAATDYNSGTVVELTATGKTGWKFKEWTGDLENTDNPAQITVDGSKTVKAVFVKKQFAVSITIEGEDGGTVETEILSGKGGGVWSESNYEYETELKLTAKPSAEWQFIKWKEDLEGTENPKNIIVDTTKSVTAVFIKKQYPLTLEIIGEGSVAEKVIKAGVSTDYNSGTIVELTATPKEGWEFIEWTGDLTISDNPAQITIDDPKTVKAVFLETSKSTLIFLDDNGVTVKATAEAKAGDTGEIAGETYTVVDLETLKTMISENKDVTKVVTTLITNMDSLFKDKTDFNQDISSWDVSNVTSMRFVFSGIQSKYNKFNQDIGIWNVSNVTDMSNMFNNSNFNQDIGKWDVSNVTKMEDMFLWSDFNQDIGDWDVSSVTNFRQMLHSTPFNQDIGDWDVSSATNMVSVFAGSQFNHDINSWDVSNVTDMFGLFHSTPFNQPLDKWDMSKVTRTESMFSSNDAFNQDISEWNVENVEMMRKMFKDTDAFNQDIGSWNVSNVTNMDEMFNSAASFNQDLSSWCVTNVTSEPTDFSTSSPLTEANKPVWGTCGSDNIYLDDNGVTVKARSGVKAGDTGEIAGEKYTVVDLETLKTMISEAKDVTKVVTTLITNMGGLLDNARFADFNQDISSWDLSNVTDISEMFFNQKTFNQDISSWDVSNVNRMVSTFTGTESFNQPLDSWDVSNVTDMNSMFWYAKAFNQDLNSWDVSNVTDMNSMFDKASSFDGDVSNWDVSSVTTMLALFAYTPFNKDISSWDVSNVTGMNSLFYTNSKFDQDISSWDTSSAKSMGGLFARGVFNQDISSWNVSNVTDMHSMFEYNDAFNQDISQWNVGNVTTMKQMFLNADAFNQDIGSWNVSNVTDMDEMFLAAASFNQDLSSWCVSNITSEPENFSTNSPLEESYKPVWGICDATNLVAWYPFNNNANDYSGNDNNGTVNGAVLTKDRFGNENRAYDFDGIDDYIEFQEIWLDQSENFTISAWVMLKSTEGYGGDDSPILTQTKNGEFSLSLRGVINDRDNIHWSLQVKKAIGRLAILKARLYT
ncbi:BspA family leucine-rich repeat surface protein [Flavobacteriaceae bacterium]|nr:BspA family leucine-rich repeat surface protein [Flavobacteriaceae bacterium]